MPTATRGVQYIDPRELNDLAALAARGGLGRGTALTDCVAEAPDQLMYIAGDDLILLRDLGEVLLASCEGVVGWVRRHDVDFASLASASSSPAIGRVRVSLDAPAQAGLPKTVLIAPSPSVGFMSLPEEEDLPSESDGDGLTIRPRLDKRNSGPFEFESPQQSPGVEKDGQRFFGDSQFEAAAAPIEDDKRDSMLSMASSEALGGIGDFMLGGSGTEDSIAISDGPEVMEELREEASISRVAVVGEVSPFGDFSALGIRIGSPSADHSQIHQQDLVEPLESGHPGDRTNMRAKQYIPDSTTRSTNWRSRASKAESRLTVDKDMFRFSMAEEGAIHAALAALEVADVRGRNVQQRNTDRSIDVQSPSHSITPASHATSDEQHAGGSSLAMQLRRRIQQERDTEATYDTDVDLEDCNETGRTPDTSSKAAHSSTNSSADNCDNAFDNDDSAHEKGSNEDDSEESEAPADQSFDGPPGSEESTVLETPGPPREVVFAAAFPSSSRPTSPLSPAKSLSHSSLLASPFPITEEAGRISGDTPADDLDSSETSRQMSLAPPTNTSPREQKSLRAVPSLIHPPPPSHSPSLSPNVAQMTWSPGSPSSPHSVAATKQAVEAGHSTPEGKRPRGLTLVGRMEADLRAATGPVPITFIVGGPELIRQPSSTGIGLGLPFSNPRAPPVEPQRRVTSPLGPPPSPGLQDGVVDMRISASRFPMPTRSTTSPIPLPEASPRPLPPQVPLQTPQTNALPARRRSRSFSSVMAKTFSKGRKDTTPPLSIVTARVPPLPSVLSPPVTGGSRGSLLTPRQSTNLRVQSVPSDKPSPDSPGKPSPASISTSYTLHGQPPSASSIRSNGSTPSLSLPPSSARSSSFSFISKSSKTPRKASSGLPLPSPVSHKDYAEETIKENGMDFELVQPRKASTFLAPSDSGLGSPISEMDGRPGMDRQSSIGSFASGNSLRALPETDEWGFLKDKSPVPEIYQGRAAAQGHRAAEQKWLSIISTPFPTNGVPPKKIRKLVLESGIPSSLRGRVWAWFLASSMSARVPGLYEELLSHDKGKADEQIEKDAATAWSEHSIFAEPTAPGRLDLRNLLRAYSSFAPAGYTSEMALLAGTLLIHCVVEDAFWLLSGLVNGCLKHYYSMDKIGMRVDFEVFKRVLEGSEKEVGQLLKEAGVHPKMYLDKWCTQMFVRCLPWPTALRIIDAVVSEGPRFLLIASLTIFSLSRERLLALPRNRAAVLGYLQDLPHDSLLLPEIFMRAADKVRLKDEDLGRLRAAVEKDFGLA